MSEHHLEVERVLALDFLDGPILGGTVTGTRALHDLASVEDPGGARITGRVVATSWRARAARPTPLQFGVTRRRREA